MSILILEGSVLGTGLEFFISFDLLISFNSLKHKYCLLHNLSHNSLRSIAFSPVRGTVSGIAWCPVEI